MVISQPKGNKPIIQVKNTNSQNVVKTNKIKGVAQYNDETLANFITFYNSKSKHDYNYNIEEGGNCVIREEPVQNVEPPAYNGEGTAENKSSHFIHLHQQINPCDIDEAVEQSALHKMVFSPKEQKNMPSFPCERDCQTRQGTKRPVIISNPLMDGEIIPQAVHCDKLFIIKANNLITTSYHYCKDNGYQSIGQLPQICKKELHKPNGDYDSQSRCNLYKEKDSRVMFSRGKLY